MDTSVEYLAFNAKELLVKGKLSDIALTLKNYEKQSDATPLLLFNGSSGQQIDIDLSGSDSEVVERYREPNLPGQNIAPESASAPQKRGRGRPKLGVQGREVTLLPRHWEWLDLQRGGASATLRRLIDEDRKESLALNAVKNAQDATNRFMYAIAGNLPGFEEAIRALYARDGARFKEETQTWPVDIRDCAREFAEPAFE
jgi:uncharacterized protein